MNKPTLVEVVINEQINEAFSEYIGLTNAVREYLSLKAQLESIQEKMKVVRAPIEEALILRGESMEIAGFNCTLANCERENFNLKEARKHIDQALLKPYLSVSAYTQLRITGKK